MKEIDKRQELLDKIWNEIYDTFGNLVYENTIGEQVLIGANGDMTDYVCKKIEEARKEGREEIEREYREYRLEQGELE